jgi:hypothetical protein
MSMGAQDTEDDRALQDATRLPLRSPRLGWEDV